jgi:hypothetical protein
MGLILSNDITVQTGHRDGPEVADVFREFLPAYRKEYGLSREQLRVVKDILACRTSVLGGCVYECGACGAIEVIYRSCGNRHCPKCGKFKRAQWVEDQRPLLLPIPYFHITFTTDHGLNPLFAHHRQEMYDALLWAVQTTLKEMAGECLGGQLGFTCVLHSWGQKLDSHVHLHCIVTGGALSFDGKRWVKSGRRFLFDVKELSRRYRKRLLRKVKRLWKAGPLRGCAELDVPKLLGELLSKRWEVYAKVFAEPEHVYIYLSRYVHAVAISNSRLLKLAGGQVYFAYHDNKDGGKEKILALAGVEFVKRFLWHVLPSGFHRIRHYGLHHPAAREKLRRARELLGLVRELPQKRELSLKGWLREIGVEGVDVCKQCGSVGSMTLRGEYEQFSWWAVLLVEVLGLVGRKVPAQGRA